ncbi:hypothetical protein K438DRAFT_1973112 [Mycena galopus ATCC 62051]|nr:hypothetical protein K438DRAFT_1973112 [Mycena galopus ATCC 62051]
MAQKPGPSGSRVQSIDSDIRDHPSRVVSPDPPGTGIEEGETENQPNRVHPNAGGGGNRPGTSGPGLHTHKLFGLNRGEKFAGPPNDYRQKYAEDPPYKELADEARVWHVYNDESAIFDNDMLVGSGDSLDILLVFAGLFSGVLTTFVSQTFQALSPDNTAISNSILLELVALQRAQANGTSIDSIPAADLSFAAALSDLWVNGLWFTSLALSLTTALFAVVAKQWLRQYSSFIAGSARERATIRQFRCTSFEQWGVQLIIGLLPTVLHLSLFLFLAGLVVFLYALDHLIATVVAGITVFLCGTYMVTNTLPIFVIACPYRTPLTALLYSFVYGPLSLCMRVAIISLKIISTVVRHALGLIGLLEKTSHWRPNLEIIREPEDNLRQVERHYVLYPHYRWDHSALSWLASTTSNPSTKIILVEALGPSGPLRRDGAWTSDTLDNIPVAAAFRNWGML